VAAVGVVSGKRGGPAAFPAVVIPAIPFDEIDYIEGVARFVIFGLTLFIFVVVKIELAMPSLGSAMGDLLDVFVNLGLLKLHWVSPYGESLKRAARHRVLSLILRRAEFVSN
jgi:hypothetical protein